MAKKNNWDEIDEQFIVASVRKDRVSPQIDPPPLVPLSATVPSQTEQAAKGGFTENSPEPGKEESRRKRRTQDYESLFIRESNTTARFGKTVYIRKEFHDRILRIVQVIGANEVSLFSYIDNIIAHHFEMFQEDIIRSYNSKNNNIF